MKWSLILHGGAKDIPDSEAEAHRQGCLRALEPGRAILEAGGRALDAVEACVRALEDDPTFNAGYGSVLNRDGAVEMDAAIMEGATLDIGAVGGIAGVRHPVSVARALLKERPVLLVGDAAGRFARERDLEPCAPETMIAPNKRAAGCDTVGCVALDAHGDLVAATSTGGLEGVMPGRVGDSPLPGCGYYAENGVGAVAFSGEGEDIARVLLAARVMESMRSSDPGDAIAGALPALDRFGGDAGGIAIDKTGRIGWAHNSPAFAVAYAQAGEPTRVFLHKSEERTPE